jgi:predicted component of type VI protein secretion system
MIPEGVPFLKEQRPMTEKLDQIEAKLKAFFEKSAHLAPQQKQLHITEQLVMAMRNAIEDDPEGGPGAPGAYLLRMHPQALATWEGNPRLLGELTDALRNAAKEACIRFQTPLVIHLAEDAALDPDTVKISIDNPAGKLEETAAMSLKTGSSVSADTVRQINAFLILKDKRAISLTTPVVNLGRMLDNQIAIEDPRVSRRHAQLRIMQNHYMLIDLNSTGGTYVNGQRIQKAALRPGDVISLAGVPLIYGEDNSPTASIEQTGVMLASDPDQPTITGKENLS